MPQRFLKPGLIASSKWDSLAWITQSFYIRLITLVDDFGRYEANPNLIRSMAFPLREDIRASQVSALCIELQDAQLAIFYKANGKEYMQLLNWTEKPRADSSKYPPFDNTCEQMFATDSKCYPSSSSSSSSSSTKRLFALKELKIPDDLNQERFVKAWEDWVSFRVKQGGCKDWKDLFERQLKRCQEWGIDKAIQSIEKSRNNHWKGLFETQGIVVKKQDFHDYGKNPTGAFASEGVQ